MYQLDPLSTFEIILIAVVVVSGVSFIPAIIGAVVGVLLARDCAGGRAANGWARRCSGRSVPWGF